MNINSLYPYFRTTGAVVVLEIEYTNTKEKEGKPEMGFYKRVRARVKPKVERDWAGLGVKAPVYEALPTGPTDGMTYKKMLRYSQGIVFKFSGTGSVYRLDYNYAVTQFTNAIVLLGLASSVSIFIARSLWPTRQMIKNKSIEKLAVGTRLAEIALKAVTHSVAFAGLKRGAGGVKVEDITFALQNAGADISHEDAVAMARFIITRVNDDGSTADEEGKLQMDFHEYMAGMEAGVMIKWPRFKYLLAKRLKGKGYGSINHSNKVGVAESASSTTAD